MSNHSGIRPEAKVLSLREYFEDYEYTVPNYQRDYAWRSRQVLDLLTDLFQFFKSKDEYYVLGQVITSNSTGRQKNRKALVDGQQRSTTIYLLLIAIHRHVTSFAADPEELAALRGILAPIENILWKFDNASPIQKPRFSGVKNGASTLESLVRNEEPNSPESVSAKNLIKNLSVIERWLVDEKNFNDPQGVWDFLERILDQVNVVCLELSDETQAIDFFVKLNSRGVKLNAADLMKGLILKNANDAEYEIANSAWQEAASKVAKVTPNGAASIEFLLGAMIRKRIGQRVSKDQLYFQWEQQIRSKPRALENIRQIKSLEQKISVTEFVAQLSADADFLEKIGTGQTPELRGTRLFKSFQHYNVLLAGASLSVDAYRELCRAVEARTILQLFSDEPSQNYEKILPAWAKRIGALSFAGTKARVEEVRYECIPAFQNVDALIERVGPTLKRLRYQDENGTSRQKDLQRIRYLLARVAQSTSAGELHKHPLGYFLDTSKQSETGETAVPRDIDHVFPKNPKVIARHWPEDAPADLVHSIGNLTLLWAEANQKASDSLPIKKQTVYAESEGLQITRALALDEGNYKDITIAGKLWSKARVSLENWGPKDIQARTQLYVDLFTEEIRQSVKPYLGK